MKHIDPHVHCRDGKESYKTNIRKVSKLAKKQGIVAIFDMPNTNPPILREKDVIKRLKLARKRKPAVRYFLYVGLTADEDQIKEAVAVVNKYPEAVGLKLYADGSLNWDVSRETNQERIYKTLAELNYQGVLAVHCEKENLFNLELFDPERVWIWDNARPPEAEYESVKDQIKFAGEASFQGYLYICHVSCPESVDLISEAKRSLKIACGVTPHHLLFWKRFIPAGIGGLLLKVNPPLRDERMVEKLWQYLMDGEIDWLESDHAPHQTREKLHWPFLSGLDSLLSYQAVLSWLEKGGFSNDELEKLTYWNIKKVFGEKLKGV